MATTYTGNPATSTVDQIRLLLGDTDMTDALLRDEEILYFVSVWTNPYSAAAAAAEQIAAQFAREVPYQGDGVAVGTDQLQQKFMTLAEQLRTLGKRLGRMAPPYAGGTSVSDINQVNSSSDEVATLFGVGQDDNRRQGASTDVGSRTRADDPLISDQRYGGAG